MTFVNLGLTKGILVILVEKGTLSAPMPERVRSVNLDVSMASWRENNILEISKVSTQIEGRKKYDVFTHLMSFLIPR